MTLKRLTLDKSPDLLYITEANLMESTPEWQRQIPGYSLILPPTMQTSTLCKDSTTCQGGSAGQDSGQAHGI